MFSIMWNILLPVNSEPCVTHSQLYPSMTLFKWGKERKRNQKLARRWCAAAVEQSDLPPEEWRWQKDGPAAGWRRRHGAACRAQRPPRNDTTHIQTPPSKWEETSSPSCHRGGDDTGSRAHGAKDSKTTAAVSPHAGRLSSPGLVWRGVSTHKSKLFLLCFS